MARLKILKLEIDLNSIEFFFKCSKLDSKNSRVVRIKAQRIRNTGASTPYIGNSILIMETSDSGSCETLETPNIFLFSSILIFVTILIWSCFILEKFVLQVKVKVILFNLGSLFC